MRRYTVGSQRRKWKRIRQVMKAMAPDEEPVITGPFDKLGRFLTFGHYSLQGYARTREHWLLRGTQSS